MGSYVMVQGAVRTRDYERDGVKHRAVEVRADTSASLISPSLCGTTKIESSNCQSCGCRA